MMIYESQGNNRPLSRKLKPLQEMNMNSIHQRSFQRYLTPY